MLHAQSLIGYAPISSSTTQCSCHPAHAHAHAKWNLFALFDARAMAIFVFFLESLGGRLEKHTHTLLWLVCVRSRVYRFFRRWWLTSLNLEISPINGRSKRREAWLGDSGIFTRKSKNVSACDGLDSSDDRAPIEGEWARARGSQKLKSRLMFEKRILMMIPNRIQLFKFT